MVVKKAVKMLSIALIISSLFLLASCGGNSDLVGKWELAEDFQIEGLTILPAGTVYEFTSGGKAVMMGQSISYEDTGDKIVFKDSASGMEESNDYKISDDTLTITSEGTGMFAGKSFDLVFKRAK